jgi:hypothetical protein
MRRDSKASDCGLESCEPGDGARRSGSIPDTANETFRTEREGGTTMSCSRSPVRREGGERISIGWLGAGEDQESLELRQTSSDGAVPVAWHAA